MPPRREQPTGLCAGAPLTFVCGPAQALALVAPELAAAELALARLLHTDVATIPEVSLHLMRAGGKRLRPALTAMGARAVGAHIDALDELMCVGELLHLGSLLHDDVVDQGSTRRGQPTANIIHGNAVSVLSGDFCLARAVWLAAELGGKRASVALGRTVTAMAEGEMLQLERAGDLSCSHQAYLEIIERKSAALIAWCAAAGAYVLRDEPAIEALEAFGQRIGVAFQITDDVLDYREGTGKDPGADLRQRKVTLPLLVAMERLYWLRPELKAGAPSPARVGELVQEIAACGALESAMTEAREHATAAMASLEVLSPGQARDSLHTLASYLVERAV